MKIGMASLRKARRCGIDLGFMIHELRDWGHRLSFSSHWWSLVVRGLQEFCKASPCRHARPGLAKLAVDYGMMTRTVLVRWLGAVS